MKVYKIIGLDETSDFSFIDDEKIALSEIVTSQKYFYGRRDIRTFRRYLYIYQEVEILQTFTYQGGTYHIAGFYNWKNLLWVEGDNPDSKIINNQEAELKEAKSPILAIIKDSEIEINTRKRRVNKVISDWFNDK